MIHVLRSFSVRPLRNTGFLSMSKAYPVLWVDVEGTHYAIRGDNGGLVYLGFGEATIETEV